MAHTSNNKDTRLDRARAVMRELQDRGETRTRHLREVAARSVRARREFVRLLRKEVRRNIDVRNATPPSSEPARSPSSSKS